MEAGARNLGDYARAAQVVLDRMTYYPGSKFYAAAWKGRVQVRLSYKADESAEWKRELGYPTTEVTRKFFIDLEGLWSEDHFVERVRRELYESAKHEVDEFLRLDGEHVTDPHPELRT